MRIAIDAMGGDKAPKEIVLGAQKAAAELKNVDFLLFGDQTQIKQHLTTEDLSNLEVIHTSEVIESDDEPVRAVRRKKDASMVVAGRAVKEGRADALFSAGNTGALLATGLLVIGRLPAIDRPGLMATMPVLSDKMDAFTMLDVGANADSKPINLQQHAILGSFYAKYGRGIKHPTVALLNNGSEASKGSDLTQKAFALLRDTDEINFIGNVEARDLLMGAADVVVADGFTGNAVLKSIEGTALGIAGLLKDILLNAGTKNKLAALLLKDSLKEIRGQLDYSEHGGAILIGLRQPVFKTHGSAESEAVYNTLKQISSLIQTDLMSDLNKVFGKKKEKLQENNKEETNGR